MKKIIYILFALLICVPASRAQGNKHSVTTKDVELTRTGERVKVTFTVEVGRKAAKAGYNLVLNPVIYKGNDNLHLPAVIVQGGKARVAIERYRLAAGKHAYRQEPVFVRPGGSVKYSTDIPYEEWMTGAQLTLSGVSVGCCSSTEAELGVIAGNILNQGRVAETPAAVPAPTTGDVLAGQYEFVAAAVPEQKSSSPFDYNMPLHMGKGVTAVRQNEVERFIADHRDGAISIYFRQGSSVIDRDYSTNNKNLVELISVIRTLVASGNSKIARIVIVGFASPEGSLAVNDRLAWERAVALKNLLTSNSSIDPMMVNIFNGSVDWIGLRDLVARSDMYRKHRIIDIIDHMPIWDAQNNRGRHGELMRLDGGDPYRFMMREFFPKLRQATYIKVFYENR